MKPIVLFLLFICLTWNTPAQQLLWENTNNFNPDANSRKEYYNNAVWWSNNELVVHGISNLYGHFLDVYQEDDGVLNKTINGVSPKLQGGAGGVYRTDNNHLLYYGLVDNSTYFSFLIQQLTPNGDTLPRHTYGLTNNGNLALNFIEDTLTKAFIVSGWSATSSASPFLSVLKTDENLTQQWFNSYPKIGLDTIIYSKDMVINSTNNYVAAGSFLITSKKYEHPYLVEIKPNGDTLRTKIIIVRNEKIREDAYKKGFIYTADKGYIIPVAIDTFMTNTIVADQITAIVKLDSNFNTQWVRYLTAGKNSIEPADAIEMADSTYLVCGFETERFGKNFRQTTFFKISKDGKLLNQWNLDSKICTSYSWGHIFLPNDSSLIFTSVCEKGCYIARIGGVGNPMHPQPRPAPQVAMPEPSIFLPNLITPNNDGKNETFEINLNGTRASGVQLKIFNRWGSQVYTTPDYQHNWNAEGLPDGVYYDQVIINDKKYKGWMQVLR